VTQGEECLAESGVQSDREREFVGAKAAGWRE